MGTHIEDGVIQKFESTPKLQPLTYLFYLLIP